MLNRIDLIGNIGRIETKAVGDKKVTSFSLAVSSGKDETIWFDVKAWAKLSEICEQYVKKGMKVFVSGKLTQRTYENKEKQKVTKFEVVANQVIMLSKVEEKEADLDSIAF